MRFVKVILFVLPCSLFLGNLALAQEFTSIDFKIIDPVLMPGGFSSSTDYQLTGVINQIAIGTSTDTSYKLNSGFLFFPAMKVNLRGSATSSQAMLYWNTTSSNLGWTVSGYNLGRSTTAGGPYTYSSTVTGATTTATGLTNGTIYYFVVRAEDAFGNSIATSSELAILPTAAYAYQGNYFDTASAYTDVLVNPDGTQLSFGIPANVTSSATELKTLFYQRSEDDVVVSKPLPSGKLAANTFYDLSFINPIASTSVTSLDSAATFTFTYTDSDISGISDESTLAPYRWNGSEWSLIGGSSLDAANNKITFSTQNFSTFGLMGNAPSPAPSPTPSSGNAGGGGPILEIFKKLFKRTVVRGSTGDLNNDGYVNLKDISVLLYWWQKPIQKPNLFSKLANLIGLGRPSPDINNDGKINITDLSLLLSKWTG